MPNGQKLIMPISITSVPALFLIASCKTLYGADIVNYLKPEHQREIEQATQGNMIPSNFAFASGGNNVISDTYSFLDQSASELAVEGTGGQRQMYNYNHHQVRIHMMNSMQHGYHSCTKTTMLNLLH